MRPYIAKGTAQEVEDVGVLAMCLSLADEVNTVFRIYEYVREEELEAVQGSAKKEVDGAALCGWGAVGRRDRRIGGMGGTWVCGLVGCG